jgi:hypothetical protein
LLDGRLRVGFIGMLLGLLWLFVCLAPKAEWSILLAALPAFGRAMPYGASTAAIQEIMPNQVRATSSAILIFIINLLGMELGPF